MLRPGRQWLVDAFLRGPTCLPRTTRCVARGTLQPTRDGHANTCTILPDAVEPDLQLERHGPSGATATEALSSTPCDPLSDSSLPLFSSKRHTLVLSFTTRQAAGSHSASTVARQRYRRCRRMTNNPPRRKPRAGCSFGSDRKRPTRHPKGVESAAKCFCSLPLPGSPHPWNAFSVLQSHVSHTPSDRGISPVESLGCRAATFR
jgi:hypothetical protein